MHTDKRRAGRRIRKMRRTFRDAGAAFIALGQAAEVAANRAMDAFARFSDALVTNEGEKTNDD